MLHEKARMITRCLTGARSVGAKADAVFCSGKYDI